MNNKLRLWLFCFLWLCASTAVMAIRAIPGVVIVHQPDGTALSIRIIGDENHHYITTADGRMIGKDEKGYYCYMNFSEDTAQAVITSQRAHNIDERTAHEQQFLQLIPSASAINARVMETRRISYKHPDQILSRKVSSPERASGMKKASEKAKESQYLVVLVNFADCPFQYANSDFSTWLNEPGYSANGGTGSVKDYYRDNSMGVFVPNFTVVGPYTLSHNQEYYAGNNENGEDQNPFDMIREACQMAKADNPRLNFRQFDNDGDGYMDNCYVIYAGYSEASTGNTSDMWPHSYSMKEQQFQIDDITINNYSCSAELVKSPGYYPVPQMDGIGTFTHEFGHILGLKDMYDTDSYVDGYGIDPGDYSIFASGSYNNMSRTPPCLMAFERLQMGWMTEGVDITEVKDAEDVTLESLAANKARFINCQPGRAAGTGQEWFILENRQKTGWDKYIPAHGLLITHYDYTDEMVEKYWQYNGPNNNARHRCMYIKAADGTDDTSSRQGDTFPGITANSSFTATTNPAAVNWAGEEVHVPLTNITEHSGLISFQVSGGASVWNIIKTEIPSRITDTEATFTATITQTAGTIRNAGFCWAIGHEPTIDDAHAEASSLQAPSADVSGLIPGAIYGVRAYMTLDDGTLVYGSTMTFTTECQLAFAPFAADFSSWTNGTPDCWQIVDGNGDGTTWILDEQTNGLVYAYDYWNGADDWIISKRRIHVPENGALYFTRGILDITAVENLDIMVSTKSSNIDDFYTLDRLSMADQIGELAIEEVDLSSLAGQDIYIAFRCTSEKAQSDLWLFQVLIMQKLATPEVSAVTLNKDKLNVEWTPVEGATRYYLYVGRETAEEDFATMFVPLDFFETVNGDAEVATGSVFFYGDAEVTLTSLPSPVENILFMLTSSGPVGRSELVVEGTSDGDHWEIIGPKLILDSYDSEGQEVDLTQFLYGHSYYKVRLRFTHGGRNARIKYLTLNYVDGFVMEEVFAGSVQSTSKAIVKPSGYFTTGKYKIWVAAGDGTFFYNESEPVFWTYDTPTHITLTHSTDIELHEGHITLRDLDHATRIEVFTASGTLLISTVASYQAELNTRGYKGVALLRMTSADGDVETHKITLN